MNRDRTHEWFPALLTAGSFFAMVATGIFALLDALGGSFSWQLEFAVCFACALAFASLLATHEPPAEPATTERGTD